MHHLTNQLDFGMQLNFRLDLNKDFSTILLFIKQFGIQPMNLFLDLALVTKHVEFGIYVAAKMLREFTDTQMKFWV